MDNLLYNYVKKNMLLNNMFLLFIKLWLSIELPRHGHKDIV